MTTNPIAIQPPSTAGWYIYMVECSDTTYYTGITTDVGRRLDEHNSSVKGAKYTRCRRPVTLIYFEKSESRQNACRREYAIKKMKLTHKKQLVQLFIEAYKS